jgi:hypothetical protein
MVKPTIQTSIKGIEAPAPESEAGATGTATALSPEDQLGLMIHGELPGDGATDGGSTARTDGEGDGAGPGSDEGTGSEDGDEFREVNPLGDEPDDDAGKTDDDEDGDGKQADGSLKEAPKWVQKRIDRLTAQKNDLKRELEAAKAEATAKKAEAETLANGRLVLNPTPENPLADVTSPEALETRMNQARVVRDWCLRNPDGGVLNDGNGKDVEFTAEDVAQRRAAAEDVMAFHAPQRRQWLADHSAALEAAKARYPAIFKPGPGADAYKEIVRRNPAILNDPAHPLRIGRELIGFLVESGEYRLVQKAGKPAGANGGTPANGGGEGKARTPATKPVAARMPATNHAPRQPESQQYEAAKARAMRTADPEDVLEALAATIR